MNHYTQISEKSLPDNQFELDRKLFLEGFPGEKCFQTFDDVPKRKSPKLVYQRSVSGDQYPIDGEIDPTVPIIPVGVISDLEARNEYRACISLTINETNGKGRKTADVIKVRAVWADFDGVKLPVRWDIQPSIIIETSPDRYHAYWLTVLDDSKHEVPLKSFTPLQKGIAKKFGSDEFVSDLPKAMRIPGFFHSKSYRFLSRIISYTGNRYEYGALVDAFPPPKVRQWSPPPVQIGSKWGEPETFNGSYGSSEGGRNSGLLKIIGGMKRAGRGWDYIQSEVWKHNSFSQPPLSDGEVRSILKSTARY